MPKNEKTLYKYASDELKEYGKIRYGGKDYDTFTIVGYGDHELGVNLEKTEKCYTLRIWTFEYTTTGRMTNVGKAYIVNGKNYSEKKKVVDDILKAINDGVYLGNDFFAVRDYIEKTLSAPTI